MERTKGRAKGRSRCWPWMGHLVVSRPLQEVPTLPPSQTGSLVPGHTVRLPAGRSWTSASALAPSRGAPSRSLLVRGMLVFDPARVRSPHDSPPPARRPSPCLSSGSWSSWSQGQSCVSFVSRVVCRARGREVLGEGPALSAQRTPGVAHVSAARRCEQVQQTRTTSLTLFATRSQNFHVFFKRHCNEVVLISCYQCKNGASVV